MTRGVGKGRSSALAAGVAVVLLVVLGASAAPAQESPGPTAAPGPGPSPPSPRSTPGAPPTAAVGGSCEDLAGSTVRMAIKPSEPFVFAGEDPRGFSIELWQNLAGRLGVRTEYVQVDTVPQVLDAVDEGRADAAVGALSITAEREARFDFSEPIYVAGLQTMTQKTQGATARDGIAVLIDTWALQLIALLVALVVVGGVLIWLVERRRNPDFDKGLSGIGHGMWWAVVTMGTVGYGDKVARTKTGRFFSAVWILFCVLLVAQVTATVTTRLTVQELTAAPTSLTSLDGKSVVTVAGTAPEALLRQHGVDARSVPDVATMVDEVDEGRADVAIYDAPILRYAATQDDDLYVPTGVLTLDYYGIAMPKDSAISECVDRALLDAIADGTWNRIDDAWFGED